MQRELELLKKELETLGDSDEEIRLQLRSEVDRIRLEIEALRRTLNEHIPDFSKKYSLKYEELRKIFDPEKKYAA